MTASMPLTRPAVALSLLAALACGKEAPPREVSAPAPDTFRVAFETSRGRFVVEAVRAWAPNGADRFHALAREGFFDGNRFFRVVPGFVAQFGIADDGKADERWEKRPLADDSVRQHNVRGTIVFTSDGPNTRSHQMFVNLADNSRLDRDGFAPFGRVVEGMAVVDSLYDDYGEDPQQRLIRTLGNNYLQRMFPKLDYIVTARVLEPVAARP